MAIPFALVNSPTEAVTGISPSINEVTPAWMLSDNMYSLFRNEDKFEQRQKGLRMWKIGYESSIFRPEIMQGVVECRNMLAKADPSMAKFKDGRGQAVYTDRQISGLGKNWLRESARVKAIATYTSFLQWYAVRGLWRRLQNQLENSAPRKLSGGCNDDVPKALSSILAELKEGLTSVDLSAHKLNLTGFRPTAKKVQASLKEANWAHEKKVLLTECSDPLAITSLLRWFADYNLAMAQSCVDAKKRDDERGAKIIGESYTESHERAEDNKVCTKAIKAALEIKDEIEAFLGTSKL